MWFSFGPVCATCSAHSGAARQNSTMKTNTPAQNSATLLRRNRSHARYHGLRPWICDLGTPAGSGGSPGASISPTVATIAPLLDLERRVVLIEQQMVIGRVEVHALGQERRVLLVPVRCPHRLLHVCLVKGRVLLFDAAVADQLRQQLVLFGVVGGDVDA